MERMEPDVAVSSTLGRVGLRRIEQYNRRQKL
jgi:hypothetical protein